MKNIKNAWISPTGQFISDHTELNVFSCTFHNDLALCILKDKWNTFDKLDTFDKCNDELNMYGYEYLESIGYVRLQTFGDLDSKIIIPKNKKLTNSQEKVILDWCMVNGENYNKVIK